MKIVYIISRSTSANRSAKDHADNGHGQPLCGDKPRGRFNGWSQDDGEVTCDKCKAMLAEQEARNLSLNDRVIWNNDAYDRGTVTIIVSSGFYVKWDNGHSGWIDFRDAAKVSLFREVA